MNKANFTYDSAGVIVGGGPIGLLVLQAFKATGGGKTICIDLLDERLDIAQRLGADEIINSARYNGTLEVLGDVVFETAGNSKTTESLFSLARSGSKVVQIGWPEKPEVKMNIANFLDKELDYIGVNRYANAFPTAISILASGKSMPMK